MKKLLFILVALFAVTAVSVPALAEPQYHQTAPAGKNVDAYYYNGGVTTIKIQINGNQVVGVWNGRNWDSVNATIQPNRGGDSSTSSPEWYQFTARLNSKARIGNVTVYFNK